MLKMSHAGENHADMRAVGGFDHILIGNRTPGLQDHLDAGFRSQLDVVGLGQKCLGNKKCSSGIFARFAQRGCGAVDTAGLAAADPDGFISFDQDNGVGFNIFDNLPAK